MNYSGFPNRWCAPWKSLREISPALLLAGAFGACLVFGIAFLIPRIGAGKLTLIMLAGQIVGGLILSHFG
ncbi:MAG TPA: DMT family transporter [Edaphobacter sp.]|nr:DMT family transporter [Edaphobacter sp.]